MIIFNGYSIDKISENDASQVHILMSSNTDRFQRYFPKTLERNLTFDSSREFAFEKVKQFEAKEEFLFVLKETSSKQAVGLIYIKELDWSKKQGEFAYCIEAQHEGKGLISIAVKRLSRYAFDVLNLKVLQIIVNKDNPGSIKVAEKCNFTWQETLLKEYTPPGEAPIDMELYELKK